ncbi:MAG TPA: hypothetical protein VMM35_02140 [Longimicrobiales bacterium]|nr:hypothetical protein [Longimicrobiales bacterium]
MQILPIDVVALVSVILGISIVLVPVIGLTARFALKPAVEALARVFEARELDESVKILERRVELQEHQIEALQDSLKQLSEARDFDRQLAAPPPTGTAKG